MSRLSAHRITPFRREANPVSVTIVTDPPGRTETPASPNPRVAVHLGRSVYMACQRGGLKHGGWAVHGDIDIVPAKTPCVWEPNGPDTALTVGIDYSLITTAGEDLGFRADRLEYPVHQYVIQRRVERAKKLLCEGKSSVSEVAQETGFCASEPPCEANAPHSQLCAERLTRCSFLNSAQRITLFAQFCSFKPNMRG